MEQITEATTVAGRMSPVIVTRNPAPLPDRRLYSVKEVCQICNMSPATFWRRVKEFQLRKIGRRTLITAESVDSFLAALPSAGLAA